VSLSSAGDREGRYHDAFDLGPVARAGIECEGLRRPTETHPRERIRREATSHVTSGAAEELRLGESDRVNLHV